MGARGAGGEVRPASSAVRAAAGRRSAGRRASRWLPTAARTAPPRARDSRGGDAEQQHGQQGNDTAAHLATVATPAHRLKHGGTRSRHRHRGARPTCAGRPLGRRGDQDAAPCGGPGLLGRVAPRSDGPRRGKPGFVLVIPRCRTTDRTAPPTAPRCGHCTVPPTPPRWRRCSASRPCRHRSPQGCGRARSAWCAPLAPRTGRAPTSPTSCANTASATRRASPCSASPKPCCASPIRRPPTR